MYYILRNEQDKLKFNIVFINKKDKVSSVHASNIEYNTACTMVENLNTLDEALAAKYLQNQLEQS